MSFVLNFLALSFVLIFCAGFEFKGFKLKSVLFVSHKFKHKKFALEFVKLVKFCQICVKILTKFAKFTREIRTKLTAQITP